MNPLTNVKNIQKLSKTELEQGVPIEKSWHQQYKDSAWIFIGGLNYDLTEGDIICVFSQYGEVGNINLIRDHKTGKSKGFGFLCYEDQRSTILAVDNLNGMKLASRITRVDHVEEYRVPKMREDNDPERQKLFLEGCAPQLVRKEQEVINLSPDLSRVKVETIKSEPEPESHQSKDRKKKKKKKEKKKSKKRKHYSSLSSSSESSSSSSSSEEEEEEERRKRKKSKKESRRR